MENAEAAVLLRQVRDLRALRAAWRRETGGGFNVFSVLGIARDERRTHCRLLYELLCPEGCHGMGDVFLREFFAVLGREYPGDGRVPVEREVPFRNGRYGGQIDLLLEGEGFCWPIEVKIDAPDQPLQLRRYADFAAARARDARVCYLTLDGREPPADSTGGDGARIVCLSFAGEIRAWMERYDALLRRICAEIDACLAALSELGVLDGPH